MNTNNGFSFPPGNNWFRIANGHTSESSIIALFGFHIEFSISVIYLWSIFCQWNRKYGLNGFHSPFQEFQCNKFKLMS